MPTVSTEEINIAITSSTTDIIHKEVRLLTADKYENMKKSTISIRQSPNTMKIFFEIWLLSILRFSLYAY